jgi:hypothetical protein
MFASVFARVSVDPSAGRAASAASYLWRASAKSRRNAATRPRLLNTTGRHIASSGVRSTSTRASSNRCRASSPRPRSSSAPPRRISAGAEIQGSSRASSRACRPAASAASVSPWSRTIQPNMCNTRARSGGLSPPTASTWSNHSRPSASLPCCIASVPKARPNRSPVLASPCFTVQPSAVRRLSTSAPRIGRNEAGRSIA